MVCGLTEESGRTVFILIGNTGSIKRAGQTFCLIALFAAACKLVIQACFSTPARVQNVLLGVKQMHVVDSIGVVFLLGAVF